MKYAVYKVVLPPKIAGLVEVDMEQGSIPLHVALQHNAITVWYHCTPGAPKRKQSFFLAPTGLDAPSMGEGSQHVGTLLLQDGHYVLHVFTFNPD